MDPDILELVGQERVLEAAQMASLRGQAADASTLFERACDWARAAEEALRADDPRRALDLALRTGNDAIAERATAGVIAEPKTAEAVAAQVALRGHDEWAARILEGIGHDAKAANAWERGGKAVQAARLFERLGDVARAVKVLEAALRREPEARTALALGQLLIRAGKDEAAVRVLQRIAHDVPERRDALLHLAGSLARVGLARASVEATEQLAALGGSPSFAAEPAAKTHDRLFGRYRVTAEIASSSTARVLDGEDPVRGERVVIKVFAVSDAGPAGQRARARFEHDMRLVSAMDHPNIVPVRAFFTAIPAAVLARMDGGTLEAMLSRGPLAPTRAAEIAAATLAGLAAAQRLGILHGDVKPSNVLFDAAGAARLADFGAADLSDASATATAGAFGALGYRSPEERDGRPGTTRSDVFSVGVLLHEMLTGQRPNPGATIRTRPSAVHPALNDRHDALVARLTARDPALRPADAFAARGEIQALSWPSTIRAVARGEPFVRLGSGNPGRDRLEPMPDGHALDTWTGRAVERIPLSEAILARARAFALTDHPTLQAVLRVDREGGALWLAASRGQPLSRALTREERALLADALEALHRAGIAHGAVDAAHGITENADGVTLQFAPAGDAEATFESDRAALARLS